MRGGIILSIICGCFLFWQNAIADGEFINKYTEDILVTPPALLEVTDNFTNYKKPYINGSVLNEVKKVKIIIDKVLVDEFLITKNDFTYQSKWNLKLGPHFAYAIGFDELGRASKISNVINFNVKKIDPHEPRISATKIEIEKEKIEEQSDSLSQQEEVENGVLGEKINNIDEDIKINKEFLYFLVILLVFVGWFWYNNT